MTYIALEYVTVNIVIAVTCVCLYHRWQNSRCNSVKIKWQFFIPKIIYVWIDLLELFLQM